jgi:hypothetical protein
VNKYLILKALSVIVGCLTLLIGMIYLTLWQYRILVSLVLGALVALGLFSLIILLSAYSLNEMRIRQVRYQYRKEIPLNREGYPVYTPPQHTDHLF